jgi:hypothetical protein
VPPKSSQTPFQLSHAFDFGLKIVERDLNTKKVVSCHCEFCVYYGREANVGTKRRKTTNIQYFKNHSEWTISRVTWSYSIQLDGRSILICPMKEKRPISRIPSHTKIKFKNIFKGQRFRTINFWMDKTIVEGIIGEMYFHPEDKEQVKEGRKEH